MQLCEVSIKNFRAIRDLEGLRLHSFSSLVGKNDCGKSSVLLAVQRFIEGKADPADFCTIGQCAQEFWVQCTFAELPLEVTEQLTAEHALDAQGHLTLRRSFRLGAESKSALHIVCRDYVDDDFRNLPARSERELNDFISQYGLPPVGKSGAGRTNEQRWLVLWRYAEGQGLEQRDGSLRLPHKDTQTLIGKHLPAYHPFPSQQPLDTTASPFQKDFKTLLVEALSDMEETEAIRTRGRDAVSEEVAAIEQILLRQTSQVSALDSEIDFQPQESATVVLHVTDHAGVRNELTLRGMGTQRLVVVAFLKRRQQRAAEEAHAKGEEEDPDKPFRSTIYAIEEPETYLHPAAQRDFFYDLKGLADTAGARRYQVIVTTHSTVFVDRMNPCEVALLTRDDKGVATARQVTEEDITEAVRLELGLRNSDYFFANCLLCYEGETEDEALPQLAHTVLHKSLDEMGIQPVNLKGKTKGRPFVEAAHKIGIPVLLLADADADELETSRAFRPSEMVARGIIERANVFKFDQGDLEYQFPVDVLQDAIKALPDLPRAVSQAELTALRSQVEPTDQKLGKAIKCFFSETLLAPLSRRMLGRGIGAYCSEDAVPGMLRALFERARHYAGHA